MPARDEIHICQTSLHDAARQPQSLTEAEREIADGIRGARAHARYVAGRTLLRRRLGRLLDCDPLSVPIACDPDGKPALAEPALSFNVSHAGELVLIAVSRPRRLGVDVEQIRAGLDVRAVVEEALGAEDREAVERAVEREGARAFFRYWTRYEAVVKARGDGLLLPLRDMRQVAAGFDVHELDVPAGYVGAVAADGGPWQAVRCA